jgi:hypothetical protein
MRSEAVMVNEEAHRPPDVSFAIHIWFDVDDAWRGRVIAHETVLNSERSAAFLDSQSLLGFIQDCIEASHVSLPRMRGPA